MRLALRQAMRAFDANETPTGCVIVRQPAEPSGLPAAARILARAHNQTEQLRDATAHAEMIAITQAANARGDWRLIDTVLYVTKEPCPMCAGAIVSARIPEVVWGCSDPKRGGALSCFNILNHPNLNHRPLIKTDVLADESLAILQEFFQQRRQNDL